MDLQRNRRYFQVVMKDVEFYCDSSYDEDEYAEDTTPAQGILLELFASSLHLTA